MTEEKVTNRYTVVIGDVVGPDRPGNSLRIQCFVGPLQEAFGWARTETQWVFSLALVSFALTMIPAGRLQDKIGPRKVAYIGGALLGCSFLLGALLLGVVARPWALYATYGIMGGAGIGFAYVCPIAALVKWFPDKKGLMTGVAVAGFGAGALFFAGPAAELMQPSASNGDQLGISQIILIGVGALKTTGFGIGWKSFFVIHGVMCMVLVFVGASLLKNPPEGWTPKGFSPLTADTGGVGHDLDSREMLSTPLACIIWLTFIFGATSGLMAIGQWKPMMGAILEGKKFAPEWMGGYGRFIEPVGILAIFNALGRVFWGKVSDIIARPRAMMVMFLMQGITFMLLISVKSHLAVFLASALVGLNFGGNFALFPSATADYFGSKNLGMNYGWIFTAYGVAGIMGPIAGGVLFEATNQYILAFVFSGILCFVAAGCSVVAWGLARAEFGKKI